MILIFAWRVRGEKDVRGRCAVLLPCGDDINDRKISAHRAALTVQDAKAIQDRNSP